MKHNEFLKYLRSQGCEFIREGSRPIHGGGIPGKTNDRLFQDIPKSTIISHEKYVRPWHRTNKMSHNNSMQRTAFPLRSKAVGKLGR